MPSIYFREKVLLGKKETTYGTEVTLAASNAILSRDLKITPTKGESEELTYDNGGIGHGPMRRTSLHAGVAFKADFAPSGTAGTPPAWGFLMEACGFVETVVASTSVKYELRNNPTSLTLAYHNPPNKHPMVGARGMCKLDMTPGKHPVFDFGFDALRGAPVNASAPTVNTAAWKDPIPVNFANTTTVSLFGHSVALSACSFDFGQQVEVINVPGLNLVDLPSHKPTCTITILEPGIAAKDYYALDAAGTLGAFSLVHGSGAGKVLTLASPALTQISNLDVTEYKGRTALSMTLRFVDGADGRSDFSITNT